MSPKGIAEHAGGDIYVADSVAVSVFVFSAGSNGNVSPAATISGGKTGLDEPLGIALDSSLNIYVANSSSTVTVYSDGSSGNVSPTATIGGDKTGLDGPIGVTLDSGNKIYVVDETSSSVTIYPPLGESTGPLNEAPSAAISTTMTTGLTHPQEIALDSNGNIYVADDFASSVFVYPAGSNGNAVPTAIISGGKTDLTSPYGIALDATGNIYVADYGLRRAPSRPACLSIRRSEAVPGRSTKLPAAPSAGKTPACSIHSASRWIPAATSMWRTTATLRRCPRSRRACSSIRPEATATRHPSQPSAGATPA